VLRHDAVLLARALLDEVLETEKRQSHALANLDNEQKVHRAIAFLTNAFERP